MFMVSVANTEYEDCFGTVHVLFPLHHVGVSRGYTDYHQGRAIHMADSRIH